MTSYSLLTPLVVALGLAAGCAGQPEHVHSTSPVAGAPGAPQPGGPPPLWKNLGAYSHPITTISPRAQAYFDQGLRLTYGFNHAEAQRSFREAARVDPSCAMCQWGIAITYGSNYNDPTNPDREQGALAAAQKAQALAVKATPPSAQSSTRWSSGISRRARAAPPCLAVPCATSRSVPDVLEPARSRHAYDLAESLSRGPAHPGTEGSVARSRRAGRNPNLPARSPLDPGWKRAGARPRDGPPPPCLASCRARGHLCTCRRTSIGVWAYDSR